MPELVLYLKRRKKLYRITLDSGKVITVYKCVYQSNNVPAAAIRLEIILEEPPRSIKLSW